MLMLPNHVIAEIRRLVDEGTLSLRAIARRVGVSRGTVLRVAHGERQPKPEPAGEIVRHVGRCPDCGRKMELPCRACAVERETLDAFEFDPDAERGKPLI